MSEPVRKEIELSILERMVNDLETAARPKVEFCEDIDKMRFEAQEIRLELLHGVLSSLKFELSI